MAITISCPVPAQLRLRELLSNRTSNSVEALVRAFMRDHRVSEQKIRELAMAHRTTITAIVRGLMCSKYPDLKPLWPLSKHTPAQIAGIAQRTRTVDGGELKRALELLSNFMADPRNMRNRTLAKAFLARHNEAFTDCYGKDDHEPEPTQPAP